MSDCDDGLWKRIAYFDMSDPCSTGMPQRMEGLHFPSEVVRMIGH